MNDENTEGQIFVRNNLTDFEKLLFAQGHIKELKEELKRTNIKLGQLKSDYDELIDLHGINPKSLKESISALKSENKRLRKYFASQGISVTEEMKPSISSKAWKVRYDKLFQEYIKLKNPIN